MFKVMAMIHAVPSEIALFTTLSTLIDHLITVIE